MTSEAQQSDQTSLSERGSSDAVHQELLSLRALLEAKEEENKNLQECKHDLTTRLLHKEAMMQTISKELERANQYGEILKEELRMTEELLSASQAMTRTTTIDGRLDDTDDDEDSDDSDDFKNFCVDSVHLTKRKSNGISRIISLEECFSSDCEIDNE